MTSRLLACTLVSLLLFSCMTGCGGSSSTSSSSTNSGGSPTPGSSNPGGEGPSGGEYLYAVEPASNDQSTFTLFQLDTNTGTLTQKASATIPVRAANDIATDQTGTNAYVAGFEAPGTNLDLAKVNPSAGTMTPFPGQTFHSARNLQEGDCCPSAIAVDPSGSTAYVGGQNDGTVHFFHVDTTGGAWTQVNTYPGNGGAVYRLALDPSAKHLYSSQRAESHITGWSRASDGQLTMLSSSPFQTSGNTSTVSISPDGKWLFVPHYELATFDIFALNADGSITLKQANVPAGNAPSLAITDPKERFLFVSNSGGYNGGPSSISAFRFDSTSGGVTPVSGSPFASAQAQQIVTDPAGRFLYSPGFQQQMVGFAIDQNTGALTPITTSLPAAAAVAIVKQ